MSFFSSLQQYVTSGVAGLGLSPRRFSLSRQESHETGGTAAGGAQGTSSSQSAQPQSATDKPNTATPVHGKLSLI